MAMIVTTKKYSVYLVHCKKFKERLAPSLEALGIFEVEPTIILTQDGDELSEDFINSCVATDLWSNKVNAIRDILLENANSAMHRKGLTCEAVEQPIWLRRRCLSPGEVSVLLKHFTALLMLANSKSEYGFIFEDDVRIYSASKQVLHCLLQEINEHGLPDYFDVVGGCGLEPSPEELHQASNRLLIPLKVPRTRTNAGYAISRNYAMRLISSFMPLTLPIDWHYQALFKVKAPLSCKWLRVPLLLHGSELGLVKSWRDSVV